MAYDEELAHRISQSLQIFPEEFEAKRMFGGLCFLYQGKMTLGIVKGDLAVRIIEEKHPNIWDHQHVRPMDFTKKPMKDFIYVSPEGFETEEQLLKWLEYGLEHAKSKLEK